MNDVTVKIAFEQFLAEPKRKLITRSKYRYKLGPFLAEQGEQPVSSMTAGPINDWFAKMEQTYAEASLAMVRSCLITFFNFCVAHKWLAVNPAKQLPRYDDRPVRVITANEEHLAAALTICGFLAKSYEARNRRDAAIFALAAISGARRSNIVNMPFRETVAALNAPVRDEMVGNIYQVATKGKTPIKTVFGDWHAAILRSWLEVRPSTEHNRLFCHTRPTTLGQPLQENGVGHARKHICLVAGVPVITFQELRKLRGTKIARKYGLELAAEALGHISGIAVVKNHYYDPDERMAQRAILETGRS